MIKFTASGDDDRVHVGLGLSHENLRRLKAGQPIRVQLADLGIEGPPHQILIFSGENEEVMTAQLYAHGFIGPETVVQDEDERP